MTEACPFCRLVDDDPALVTFAAYDDGLVFAVPSLEQKATNRGHTLVVPREHMRTVYELPPHLAGPLMKAVSVLARAVKLATGAEGVTIRQNNDPAGGQDVFHLHIHVIPRWIGDGYFTFDTPYEVVPEGDRREQARRLRESIARAEEA